MLVLQNYFLVREVELLNIDHKCRALGVTGPHINNRGVLPVSVVKLVNLVIETVPGEQHGVIATLSVEMVFPGAGVKDVVLLATDRGVVPVAHGEEVPGVWRAGDMLSFRRTKELPRYEIVSVEVGHFDVRAVKDLRNSAT